HPEEPDYRPFTALNFLHAQLAECAKAVGIRNAKIERSVMWERAKQQGIPQVDIDAAIALAVLCRIMIEQEGIVRFIPGKESWPSPKQQHDQIRGTTAPSPVHRPNRARAFPIIKDIVARRTDGRARHA